MLQKPNISYVIPCYNEENRIGETLKQLRDFCEISKKHFGKQEVIVVDDGSTDKTNYVVTQHYKAFSGKTKLKYKPYIKNRGKGFAVRQGLYSAKHPIILILDADLSVPPSEITLILQLIDNLISQRKKAIIYGTRQFIVPQSLFRRFVGFGYRQLVNLLVFSGGITQHDTQCPFKVLVNWDMDDFYDALSIDGFSYDVELLYYAYRNKYLLFPQWVVYFNNPDSRVTFRKAAKMFFELLEITRATRRPRLRLLVW